MTPQPESIVSLPDAPRIASAPAVDAPTPFQVVSPPGSEVDPPHAIEEPDRLADLRERLLAREAQLEVFAERADIEAREAHARAISLNRQLRLARAARLALEGW